DDAAPADEIQIGPRHLTRVLRPPYRRPGHANRLLPAQHGHHPKPDPQRRVPDALPGRGNLAQSEQPERRESEGCQETVVHREPPPPGSRLGQLHVAQGVPSNRRRAEERRVAQGRKCSPAPDLDGQEHFDDVQGAVERDETRGGDRGAEQRARLGPHPAVQPQLARDDRPRQRGQREETRGERVGRTHAADASSGSASSKVMPTPPAPRAAATPPPCASTVRFTMASPSPVPFGLSEKKGSKSRGSASGGRPAPLSLTRIVAQPFAAATWTAISRRGASVTASTALSSRFRSASRSLSR